MGHVSLNGSLIQLFSLFGLYFRVTQKHNSLEDHFLIMYVQALYRLCFNPLKDRFGCVRKITLCTGYSVHVWGNLGIKDKLVKNSPEF